MKHLEEKCLSLKKKSLKMCTYCHQNEIKQNEVMLEKNTNIGTATLPQGRILFT